MTVASPEVRRGGLVPELPPDGRAAIRGGVWGNYIDQINIFLPVTALAPALPVLAGPHNTATTAAIVVMATLVGRPLGAMVFGQVSDRIGRTSTTKVAIAGTAACTLGIALVPDWTVLGAATIGLVIALRFIGGAFLAGEYTSAIPLAMEWSTPRRRGLVSGRIMSMAPWAQGTIAFVTVGLLALLGLDAYAAWGWRVSFVAGAVASLVMLVYYSRRVADSPLTAGRAASASERVETPAAGRVASASERVETPGVSTRSTGGAGSTLDVLFGRWAGPFWQVFGLMTGLWFCTNMVVIVVTQRLPGLGLSPLQVSLVMGVASVAQALVMAQTGHLSTLTGRRRFFVGGGLVMAVGGPLLWWVVLGRPDAAGPAALGVALVGVALMQVLTVTQYGPVGAYLNERFPTQVRATAYGTAYSLSIVVPALYPFYLPALTERFGPHLPVVALMALGGLLVAGCAGLGPAMRPADIARNTLA